MASAAAASPDLCESSPQRDRRKAGWVHSPKGFLSTKWLSQGDWSLRGDWSLQETGHCVPSGGRVTQGAELGSVRTRDSYSGVSAQFSEGRLSPKSDHSPTAALPQ